MPKVKNPINPDEKEKQAQQPVRETPQIETDTFSAEEQKKIVRMVMDDAQIGIDSMQEWKEKKRKDLLHINSAKPSEIEGLEKKGWMSDRNLGLTAGILDIFQATLLATCYNPDFVHYKDTMENDVNNKDNLEKFTKWVLSDSETKAFREFDDFINNRVSLGFSVLKIEWETKFRWVDKRIPKFSTGNKRRIIGYDIKTENMRFERGVIRNIDHLDNILIPEYGKDIQELPFLIEILTGITRTDLEDFQERGIIINFDNGKFSGLGPQDNEALKKVDEEELGSKSTPFMGGDAEKRNQDIDIYEYHGWFTKNGKHEEYRFWIEPKTWTFLSGIPLRKINRSGRKPYVGGPLRRRPGFIRGGSLTTLIAPAINALNNNYNQTSDFQFWENCPFGFYDKNQEGLSATIQDVEPMKLVPIDGDPNKSIMFPNLSRSLAWSYQDKQFLMQIIERLTGAASYFLTSGSQDSTATRDNIVEQKGEVKFGLWVKRLQVEMAEAINMLIQMYQDWAPPDLAKRVVGEDGKAIIKNLSINSLRGNYGPYLVPDITSGSKAYERQVSMFAFTALQQGSIWLSPQVNPRGNWLLTKFVMQKQGIENPEHYLPPCPKEQGDYHKESEEDFNHMLQGDTPEPPAADNPQIVECMATMLRLKETRYQELDEEYKPNFENYLFKAYLNYGKFMQKVAQEQAAMKMAALHVNALERAGITPQGSPAAQPGQPIQPGGNNAAIVPKQPLQPAMAPAA